MNNHYDTLGVKADATQEQIKKAYRALSKKHHPDMAGGDTALFQAASEAYQVLSDEARRREYDMMLQGGPFSGFGFPFGNPFGNGSSSWRPVVRDSRMTVNVSLEQVYAGTPLTVQYARQVRTEDSQLVTATEQQEISDIGLLRGPHMYRYSKMGNYSPEADDYGDLQLVVEVWGDQRFRVSGDDMYAAVQVHYADAIDGAKVDFAHIDGGTLRVKLPARCQKGQTVKLAGKGLMNHFGGRGDLYLTVDVTIDYDRVPERNEQVDKPGDAPYNGPEDPSKPTDNTEDGN